MYPMLQLDPRLKVLAILLASVAGYVDAIGYISLGGFFVSFMSGNSTRLGIGVATLPSAALTAVVLIAAFVTGVAIGSLVSHAITQRTETAVLVMVALILATGAVFGSAGFARAATVMMALAMGTENAVFQRSGQVMGVTYMTGTLVKLGQRVALLLRGGDASGWGWYLLLWCGLVSGAALGSLVYRYRGLQGLWFAVVVVLGLAAVWPKHLPRERESIIT
jgi:uncharacterized membrane protein YoaK (UPF0700 family)